MLTCKHCYITSRTRPAPCTQARCKPSTVSSLGPLAHTRIFMFAEAVAGVWPGVDAVALRMQSVLPAFLLV